MVFRNMSNTAVRGHLGQRSFADVLMILEKGKGHHSLGKGDPFNELMITWYSNINT